MPITGTGTKAQGKIIIMNSMPNQILLGPGVQPAGENEKQPL